MQPETFSNENISAACQHIIEEFTPEDAQSSASWNTSLRYRLVTDVACGAADYARASCDAQQFWQVAYRGMAVIEELSAALTDARETDPFTGRKYWTFWRHYEAPLEAISRRRVPYIYREGLIEAASQYLALPYRVQSLERTLVDALMAAEVFAFGELLFDRLPFFFRHLNAAFNKVNPPNTFVSYVVVTVFGAIFWGLATAAIAWLASIVFPGPAVSWIIGVSLAIWSLGFLASTVFLPFQVIENRRVRAKNAACLEAAVRAYSELGPGVVSAVRIRQAAAAAADRGVIWPGPVFALLDDNIAHSSGRL